MPFGKDVDVGSSLTQLESALRNGQKFSATTDVASNPGSNDRAAFSLFNPSGSDKNLLVYALYYFDNSFNGSHVLELSASDPALTTTITPVNRKLDGAESVASASFVDNSYTLLGLKTIDVFATEDVGLKDFLSGGREIILPPENGIIFSPFFYASSSHFFGITVHYIELG
jgi:hypothetical protein